MLDLDRFIGKYVTKRSKSMFYEDVENNKKELSNTTLQLFHKKNIVQVFLMYNEFA